MYIDVVNINYCSTHCQVVAFINAFSIYISLERPSVKMNPAKLEPLRPQCALITTADKKIIFRTPSSFPQDS